MVIKMNNIIEVKNLVKQYKELKAIDNLSFEVHEGEILGLLGPNGSGKSTTINCILSILKFSKGKIKIFGKSMNPDEYDIKSKIGVVFQDVSVFNELTVYEIIDYLDQVYDRKYTRSTVKTYITKLKKKGFVDTQVKGNYSYITAKITEEMYREEQMELMKDFWHDGSMKELVQTLTHTISKEEKEELKDLINDLDD